MDMNIWIEKEMDKLKKDEPSNLQGLTGKGTIQLNEEYVAEKEKKIAAQMLKRGYHYIVIPDTGEDPLYAKNMREVSSILRNQLKTATAKILNTDQFIHSRVDEISTEQFKAIGAKVLDLFKQAVSAVKDSGAANSLRKMYEELPGILKAPTFFAQQRVKKIIVGLYSLIQNLSDNKAVTALLTQVQNGLKQWLAQAYNVPQYDSLDRNMSDTSETANDTTLKEAEGVNMSYKYPPDKVTKLQSAYWEAYKEKWQPVEDLHHNPTGWLAYSDSQRDMNYLLNPKTLDMLVFINPNPKSGSEATRTQMKRSHYAIDNPLTQTNEALTEEAFTTQEMGKFKEMLKLMGYDALAKEVTQDNLQKTLQMAYNMMRHAGGNRAAKAPQFRDLVNKLCQAKHNDIRISEQLGRLSEEEDTIQTAKKNVDQMHKDLKLKPDQKLHQAGADNVLAYAKKSPANAKRVKLASTLSQSQGNELGPDEKNFWGTVDKQIHECLREAQEKFMQKAVKRPGKLHKDMGLKEDQPIWKAGVGKMVKYAKASGDNSKRVSFARTAAKKRGSSMSKEERAFWASVSEKMGWK